MREAINSQIAQSATIAIVSPNVVAHYVLNFKIPTPLTCGLQGHCERSTSKTLNGVPVPHPPTRPALRAALESHPQTPGSGGISSRSF